MAGMEGYVRILRANTICCQGRNDMISMLVDECVASRRSTQRLGKAVCTLCVHPCAYIRIYMYLCKHVLSLYVHMQVCVYVYVCVWEREREIVCVHVWICVRTQYHAQRKIPDEFTSATAIMCMWCDVIQYNMIWYDTIRYIHVHICMYMCIYLHTHTRTRTYFYVHTHAHTWTNRCADGLAPRLTPLWFWDIDQVLRREFDQRSRDSLLAVVQSLLQGAALSCAFHMNACAHTAEHTHTLRTTKLWLSCYHFHPRTLDWNAKRSNHGIENWWRMTSTHHAWLDLGSFEYFQGTTSLNR